MTEQQARQPKMGGMELLNVLLKGGQDLTDCIFGPQQVPTGDSLLDKLAREKFAGVVKIRIALESGGRSDLWLQQFRMNTIPSELAENGLDGADVEAQFTAPMLTDRPDVVIFSVLPDATQALWQHKSDRYLFQPVADWATTWPLPRQQWFRRQFNNVGLLSITESNQNLLEFVRTVKGRVDAHIVAFNGSTVDPADHTHSYFGMNEDTLALRVHRLDLALMRLSVQEGISIVDVDRRIAEVGADKHVLKALTYSPEACRAVGQELFSVLADIGFFEKRRLVLQIGRKKVAR